MATYSIKEDENFPWVNLITINSNRDIDISNEVFNITVKDQLEYFVADHIKEGSTFELEELFKKDTIPTLEISNNSTVYEQQKCFDCNGSGYVTCSAFGGLGYYYQPLAKYRTLCTACGGEPSGTGYPSWVGKKGSGLVYCESCEGTGEAYTVCEPVRPMYTEVYKSNVSGYNNSDYDSLVHNGIQFWVDGVNKKTMYIRVVAKGKSTSNTAGYVQWSPASDQYFSAGYVGFTIANFNITLNTSERLNFNSFNIPKIVMGTPVPDTDEYNPPLSSYYELTGHIISGAIRTNYDWNDDYHGIDNLFVNYTTEDMAGNSANEYSQYPLDDDTYSAHWKTSAHIITPPKYLQRKYIVKSSAYLNDYLVSGITEDLYDTTSPDDVVTAYRGMNFTSANVKSYLKDEYTNKKILLPYDMTTTKIPNFKYIDSNNHCISGDLYCYEIIQSIEDSSCSGKIRKNQVKLELEI
jgi:hypothetical protein